MTDKTKSLTIASRQLRAMMAFLALEFILGLSLTTFINYSPNKHSAIQTSFLIAHIVVAIALLLGAIARVVVSMRAQYLITQSVIGLVSIIVAFISGSAAANNGSGIAAFFMGLFFLLAFIAYGYSLGKVMSHPAGPGLAHGSTDPTKNSRTDNLS